MSEPPTRFANYVEAPTRIPGAVWLAARVLALVGIVGVIIGGLAAPANTLTIFWGLLVPVLPIVWMAAPGLWRNTCPLATVNQVPRVFGFSRAATAPAWFQRFSYSIAVAGFIALVLTRKVVFNTSGAAVSLLLAAVLALAFVGGWLLKGKSGWCSAVCPLLPIQRLYGQAPVARVANAHCEPCVGCAKNCFDFNPGVAYIADMYDNDQQFSDQRTLFAGAFPGLVLAFFRVGSSDEIGAAEVYGRSAIWIIGGVAVYRVAHIYIPHRPNTLPPLFGAAGFVIFYWYSWPRVSAALNDLVGGDWDALIWPGRLITFVLAAHFVARAVQSETRYVNETAIGFTTKAAVPAAALADGARSQPSVKIIDDNIVVDAPGDPSLLEVIEEAGLSIDAGCRMGVCGADPVSVVAGSDGLTPALASEITTLSRLGLGPPNRMACVARVTGACTISLKPDMASVPEPTAPTFVPDPAVQRIVVVGNGIGGITAADYARRSHADCSIDVIGREAHHLYNRMGISKLIYSPRGVSSLNLLGEEWYERNRIRSWLNTTVRGIDRQRQHVEVGTGESLPYDRLILAMGSTAQVPAIEGFDRPGCFVVRSADHAVNIRRFTQRHNCRHAFVAGGGLLGLEAAFSLHRLGLRVTVGERSDRLLRRQIDRRGSEILGEFFESVGIVVRTGIEVAAAEGARRVESLTTATGEKFATDILVVATGISPNVALAAHAGLTVSRGVIVDEHMRTSDPNIFAVGDVAEHRGQIWGLWAVAVEQAEVAGKNAAGGRESHFAAIPTTILKGAGIDVTSFGVVDGAPSDDVVIDADPTNPFVYAKTVLRGGYVIGGVFINRAEQAVEAQQRYADFHHQTTSRL